MATKNAALAAWVDEVARLTKPDRIHWCDGSRKEFESLRAAMVADGTLLKLNPTTHPECYLHRSHPSDVARVEHLTFVCTSKRDDAGPNNHWLAPAEAHAKMDALFDGCMRGRTLYVIPYCMGPLDSPYSRCGVEITDSAYVVLNMHIMTRMGSAALARIEREGRFVKGLHSIGELDPERRFIMHFPEELTIKSFGSGYGGNALLGKKCHALRIASWQARDEGWLAEHMLIVGIEDPAGERRYVAAAFPSACGKTNLAMLIPPESMPGWKVFTVGDDIAWLNFDEQGQLRAINPEAGYFGVVPGTNSLTNRNAYEIIKHDTIFTNVALTADGEPWWEGRRQGQPTVDWKGQPWDGKSHAAHPNSRFTVAARQNPCYAPEADDPRGVPISALIFGGRRKEVAPLVFQAKSWRHGVLVAAGVASETTAAAAGQVGVVRRDSMAMKPFCGYNFGDYFAHWLRMGERRGVKLPEVFHVNWFRQGPDGKFLWPGFGENLRVVEWILDRCEGRGEAVETPIGFMPTRTALDLDGLDLPSESLDKLLSIDRDQWRREIADIGAYLEEFGDRTPSALRDEVARVAAGLS